MIGSKGGLQAFAQSSWKVFEQRRRHPRREFLKQPYRPRHVAITEYEICLDRQILEFQKIPIKADSIIPENIHQGRFYYFPDSSSQRIEI
jgi:hypothetical protein